MLVDNFERGMSLPPYTTLAGHILISKVKRIADGEIQYRKCRKTFVHLARTSMASCTYKHLNFFAQTDGNTEGNLTAFPEYDEEAGEREEKSCFLLVSFLEMERERITEKVTPSFLTRIGYLRHVNTG